MRLAVGITTISAFAPPETRTKRSRMWRSFSLFSAPPMGTIQPRFSPSGILLGIVINHTVTDSAQVYQAGFRAPRQRVTGHARPDPIRQTQDHCPARRLRWARQLPSSV